MRLRLRLAQAPERALQRRQALCERVDARGRRRLLACCRWGLGALRGAQALRITVFQCGQRTQPAERLHLGTELLQVVPAAGCRPWYCSLSIFAVDVFQ